MATKKTKAPAAHEIWQRNLRKALYRTAFGKEICLISATADSCGLSYQALYSMANQVKARGPAISTADMVARAVGSTLAEMLSPDFNPDEVAK